MKNLITEQDIIEYLMTSDFNEGLTQEESRFLLLKFRYYYRLAHANNQRMSGEIQDLKLNILDTDFEYKKLQDLINKINSDLDIEKNRKLSWKERISGKKLLN